MQCRQSRRFIVKRHDNGQPGLLYLLDHAGIYTATAKACRAWTCRAKRL
jgi:hypothetical protein